MVNLTHLRSFWAVAKSGGFSSASRLLGISQPTLSKQIQELESGYRIVLFNRGRASVALTREGRHLFPITDRLFSEAQLAGRFLAQHASTDLRLGTVATNATSRLIELLGISNPELSIAVKIGSSASVKQHLLDSSVDLGILTMAEKEVGFEQFEIGRYPLLAVFPRHHPMLAEPAITLQMLSGEKIIPGALDSGSRIQLDIAARAQGVTLNIFQEVTGSEMICDLVRAGQGVGIIGFTGIVERGYPHVRAIEGCERQIPVHLACLKQNRSARLVGYIFSFVKMNQADLTFEALMRFDNADDIRA